MNPTLLKVKCQPWPWEAVLGTNLSNICPALLSSTSRLLSTVIILLLTCPLCNDTTPLQNMTFPLAICATGWAQQCLWRECQKCFPSVRNAGNPLDSVPECISDTIKSPASGVPGPAPSSCLLGKGYIAEHARISVKCITASSPSPFSFLISTNKHLSSDLPLLF